MGFLVHVEHGAVLENALEHCTDDSHFKLNRNFKNTELLSSFVDVFLP